MLAAPDEETTGLRRGTLLWAMEAEPAAVDGPVPEAWARLRTRLRHIGRRMALVDLPATAEDLVQDAFAEVWLRWDRIDNPEAYLRTCIVNRCRRELRRRMLRRRSASEPSAATDDPTADLLDVVRALPPRRRAVVVLRFYEDMSEAQIATTLGMRPGTTFGAAAPASSSLPLRR